VMYLGRLVELGQWREVLDDPLHPYTAALAEAVPVPDPQVEAAKAPTALQGEVPSPANPPSGCVFHPRCPIAIESCAANEPPLVAITPTRRVACQVVEKRARTPLEAHTVGPEAPSA
jgi:oligopeptide/dipeptide ABC transporter ATP-binding protein